MPIKVTRETVQAVADAATRNLVLHNEPRTRDIAAETGVSRRTVRDILSHLGPELEVLKQNHRDEMLTAWHDTFFEAYDQMRKSPSSNDRKNLAITMGISTEKAQLLSGQPTALVANLHEVRVSMPELVSRLRQVARVILEPEEVSQCASDPASAGEP